MNPIDERESPSPSSVVSSSPSLHKERGWSGRWGGKRNVLVFEIEHLKLGFDCLLLLIDCGMATYSGSNPNRNMSSAVS